MYSATSLSSRSRSSSSAAVVWFNVVARVIWALSSATLPSFSSTIPTSRSISLSASRRRLCAVSASSLKSWTSCRAEFTTSTAFAANSGVTAICSNAFFRSLMPAEIVRLFSGVPNRFWICCRKRSRTLYSPTMLCWSRSCDMMNSSTSREISPVWTPAPWPSTRLDSRSTVLRV